MSIPIYKERWEIVFFLVGHAETQQYRSLSLRQKRGCFYHIWEFNCPMSRRIQRLKNKMQEELPPRELLHCLLTVPECPSTLWLQGGVPLPLLSWMHLASFTTYMLSMASAVLSPGLQTHRANYWVDSSSWRIHRMSNSKPPPPPRNEPRDPLLL